MVDTKISEDDDASTLVGLKIAAIEPSGGPTPFVNVKLPIEMLQAEFGTASVPLRHEHTSTGAATLTLQNEPVSDSALQLYSNGMLLRDYTRVGNVVTWVGIPPAPGNEITEWVLKAVPTAIGVTGKSITYAPAGVGPYAWPAGFVPVNEDAFRVYVGGIHQARDNGSGDIAYTWNSSGVTLTTPGALGVSEHVTLEVTAPLGIGVPGYETIDTLQQKSRLRALQLFERIIGSKGIAMATTALNTFATGFKGATDTLNGVTTSTNSDIDAGGFMKPSTSGAGTWDPANNNGCGLSNGNLTASGIAGTSYVSGVKGLASMAKSTGKWYFEWTVGTVGNTYVGLSDTANINAVGNNSGYNEGYLYYSGGTKVALQSSSAFGATFTNGDVIGVAYDADADKMWFHKNGTWQASGNPAAGTNEAHASVSGSKLPYVGLYSSATGTVNFGASAFAYTPPSGFSGWAVPAADNQTLEFDSQTVDSTGRVFGIVPLQAVDALGTLGTNLVVEFKIGAGSWNNCDLTSLGAMKLGSTTLTGLLFSKTGLTPGTTVQLRIRTLNNKDLRPYGFAYDAVEAA